MKNKKILTFGIILVIIVAIIISLDFSSKPNQPNESQEEVAGKTGDKTNPTATNKVSTQSKITQTAPKVSYPEVEFLDKRTVFNLKDFPGAKFTIEKVVFGRGNLVISPECQGVPNTNFTTYLYPGSRACIKESVVDGSPVGILAFHLLVENNGNVAIGGTDILKLHYLRSDPAGSPQFRFATPLIDLRSYYINGYSSKNIILSYLVPEDQLVYNLVAGYKEPSIENRTLNIYDFSKNGILIDFKSKNLTVVK